MFTNYIFKMTRFVGICILLLSPGGCSKLVEVPAPVDTITTEETFSSDGTATSAILGIYNFMATGAKEGSGYDISFCNGLITINTGMSADELHKFGGPSHFELNTLTVSNFSGNPFWNHPYFGIYMANAVLEGLENSTQVSVSTRKLLTGEAKFLRAFSYFYLVNLFGDVPLALTTAYAITDTLSRSPSDLVYQQMVTDLQDAVSVLPDDYPSSSGQRVRANNATAKALLARVFLYMQRWSDAEIFSTDVINNGRYQLESDLNKVFLINSREAILQWQLQSKFPFATMEGFNIRPYTNSDPPSYYFTTQLLGGFENYDQRKLAWVDSSNFSSTWYYFPSKYKVFYNPDQIITEYPVVLRLAEQYLIRAEARALQNNLSGAIDDLNVIRQRAGLPDLSSSLTQAQVLSALMQERRIELLSEWGHRWFDLKRTGQADAVLGALKPTWQPFQKFYPIPASELINDVNLTQNPGY